MYFICTLYAIMYIYIGIIYIYVYLYMLLSMWAI